MITETQLNNLKEFPTASWAIWNEANLGNVFYYENREKLKCDIVFLGINPSRQISAFDNFHRPINSGVKHLSNLFQDQSLDKLMGNYMTDLSPMIDPNAFKVQIEAYNKTELENQIDILGHSVSKIICFGTKAFDELKKLYSTDMTNSINNNIKHFSYKLENNQIDVYGCYHYSNRGYNFKQVAELKNQLQFINDHCC